MSYTRSGLINRIDKFFAQHYVRFLGERPGCLCAFLFHGLFRDQQERRYDLLDVQQGVTVAQFEAFVEHFLDKKYAFVTQQEILSGLSPEKRYAYITFDDGYFNNVLALDILKKFRVPATFFISTNHILQQKCFWWDVLARERWKQGMSLQKIGQEQNSLKSRQNHEIEKYVTDLFGAKAFAPIGDVDRPLTVDELKHLSRQPFVEIGNHTSNHAILPNYPYESAKAEMAQAQEHLKAVTGITPIAVSYPNGSYSAETLAAARDVGFKIGITTREGKNYLPLAPEGDQMLNLKRFTLWSEACFDNECSRARSDLQLKSLLRDVLKKG